MAAETPSYMVWIYGAHQQHTGDLSRADERFGFLRRSMLAQGISPEGLLRREHGGQQSVTTPALVLPAGGELRFTL